MTLVKLSDEKGWLPRVYVAGHETHLASWMASVEERLEQLTAGPPTTESPTKEARSGAAATGSITASMQRSSPLVPLVTESGPAALCSTSADFHQWVVPWAKDDGVIHEPRGWCQRCGALLLSDRIVVQDARQVWSTLVKQASTPSAPEPTFAPSASNALSEAETDAGRLAEAVRSMARSASSRPEQWHLALTGLAEDALMLHDKRLLGIQP
jgi:hypothetical protein